jgi:hypothetical protein
LITWKSCYESIDKSLNNKKTQVAGGAKSAGSKQSVFKYINAKRAAKGKTQQ